MIQYLSEQCHPFGRGRRIDLRRLAGPVGIILREVSAKLQIQMNDYQLEAEVRMMDY